MLRMGGGKFNAVGQFEIGEIETGGHGATEQRELPTFGHLAGEPAAGRHHRLRLPSRPATEPEHAIITTRLDDMHIRAVTVVVVPLLIGANAVEGREIPMLEQEIDRRAQAPAGRETVPRRPGEMIPGAVGFAVPATLRMWC